MVLRFVAHDFDPVRNTSEDVCCRCGARATAESVEGLIWTLVCQTPASLFLL